MGQRRRRGPEERWKWIWRRKEGGEECEEKGKTATPDGCGHHVPSTPILILCDLRWMITIDSTV
jgi:hypothetical protein